MTTQQPRHRNSIFLDSAEVISHQAFAGEQYVLRLLAPNCARTARPGSFAHLQCDPQLPMRRPISLIVRAAAQRSWS